ncbi:MAG: Hsp20/alpha crystallin family protein [Rhodospirillales bacterium]|nr:Hsp20/alpha crystallin family protein [Rhodospirillales bacterium]
MGGAARRRPGGRRAAAANPAERAEPGVRKPAAHGSGGGRRRRGRAVYGRGPAARRCRLLTIKGERKTESEKRLLSYRINERTFGSFSRSIALPAGIDADAISASFKNGVLTITIPRTQEAAQEAKRVAVKSE